MTERKSRIGRRGALATIGAGLAAAVLGARPALAYSAAQATALIDKVVADIQRIINSGESKQQMMADFEKVFLEYADIYVIGQLVLGPVARTASDAQKKAFAEAFAGYMARKYGRRFREFIGGRIEVKETKAVGPFYEVRTLTKLQGKAPFEVIFVVSDRSGKFIDMVIEGISLVKSERSEIGQMLDARGGNLNKLIADLKRM